MRTFAGAVVGSLVLLSIANAAGPVKADGVLASPVAGVRASGDSLESVFQSLARASGRNVFVNWKALEAAGVPRTLPTTLDLSAVTLGEAMTRVADNLNTPGSHAMIGFAVDEGGVTVSTTEDLAKNVETRTYDVRAWIPGMEQPLHDAPSTGPAPKAVDPKVRQAAVDRAIRRVLGIQPLTWKANGGNTGNVRELGGQLIVTHTPEVHRLIALELKQSPSERTAVVLKGIIPDLNLNAVPFAQAIEEWTKISNVSVDVQWEVLAEQGMKKHALVSMRLKNVGMSRVLRKIIDAASEKREFAVVLDAVNFFTMPDGSITVTTNRDFLARFSQTKRYMVADVIKREASSNQPLTESVRAELEESITSLIKETIAVETWTQKPGDGGGTIVFEGDTLIVRTDFLSQQSISRLLEALREPRRVPATQPR